MSARTTTGDPGDTTEPLKTPDPALTSESFLALAATVVPMLVVLFKLDISEEVQAGALTALGSVLAAFSLWHAGKVRSARALGRVTSNDGAPVVVARSE